jgi:two-component system chemotaxis response regulator CheY
MLRVTELSLRKGGYDLLVARNGREALERIAEQMPDLVVMDVVMPELDGLTALRRLRSQATTKALPVIMLTVRGHSVTREEAEQAGASLFLTKPFSPSQLLKEVRRLLEGSNT